MRDSLIQCTVDEKSLKNADNSVGVDFIEQCIRQPSVVLIIVIAGETIFFEKLCR